MSFFNYNEYILVRILFLAFLTVNGSSLWAAKAKAATAKDTERSTPTYRLENAWKSMTVHIFSLSFANHSHELGDSKASSILKKFYRFNAKKLNPESFLVLLKAVKNPEQQAWLLQTALIKHSTDEYGVLMRDTHRAIKVSREIAQAVSEPGTRKKLAVIFHDHKHNELTLDGPRGEQKFRIGDLIKIDPEAPSVKLAVIFPDGTGMTEDGELTNSLSLYENPTSSIRLLDQLIDLSITPLWKPLKTRLKTGYNSRADQLADSMKQILAETESIAAKKELIQNVLNDWPELPDNLRGALARFVDTDVESTPKVPKTDFERLYFKRIAPELHNFAVNTVLPQIESHFGARLESLKGIKARRLRALLNEFTNELPENVRERVVLDQIARELLLNYSELSVEIKVNLLDLLIDPTDAERELAQKDAALGPDSLIDTPETLTLREKAILLGLSLLLPPTAQKPLNDRRRALDDLSFKLINPSHLSDVADPLQKSTQEAFEKMAREILFNFGELSPSIKQMALSMLEEPTETQRRKAFEVGVSDPVNPIEFSAEMLELQLRELTELKPKFDKLPNIALVTNIEKLNELYNRMSRILRETPIPSDTTVASNFHELPVILRYSLLAEKIIREHADLPTKFRQSLLSFVQQPTQEVVVLANTPPKTYGLPIVQELKLATETVLRLTPQLFKELGPNGILDNQFFVYPLTMWQKKSPKLPKLPVIWLGTGQSGLTHFVTPASHVIGSWNPRASVEIFEVPENSLEFSYYNSSWLDSVVQERKSSTPIIPKQMSLLGNYPYPIELRTQALHEPEKAESLRLNYALEHIPKSCIRSLSSLIP